MVELSIILPVFNERQNIVALVQELLRTIFPHDGSLEILVVDDRSTDGSPEAVRLAFANDCRVRLRVRNGARSLAASIRHGIEQSSGAVIVVMDSDFDHPPSCVPALYEQARKYDIAVGSRFAPGGGMPSRLRFFLSHAYNLFMRHVLGTQIRDNLSGFFAVKRDVLEKFDFDSIFWGYGDYFFRLLLKAQQLGLSHIEIPVMYGSRRGGASKTVVWRILLNYTTEVLRIVYLRIRGRW